MLSNELKRKLVTVKSLKADVSFRFVSFFVRAINEGLTLETSGFKLFTVVNLRFQLS